jgi:hypothetical protein
MRIVESTHHRNRDLRFFRTASQLRREKRKLISFAAGMPDCATIAISAAIAFCEMSRLASKTSGASMTRGRRDRGFHRDCRAIRTWSARALSRTALARELHWDCRNDMVLLLARRVSLKNHSAIRLSLMSDIHTTRNGHGLRDNVAGATESAATQTSGSLQGLRSGAVTTSVRNGVVMQIDRTEEHRLLPNARRPDNLPDAGLEV